MRFLFLFLSFCFVELSGQSYNVNLRLTSTGSHEGEILKHTDYQMYGYAPSLLSHLIDLHGKGEIDIYTDLPERKAIAPDSFSNHFDLPDYTLLDSLVDWEELYFANRYKAWYPNGFHNYSDFDDEVDTSYFEKLDSDSVGWSFKDDEEFEEIVVNQNVDANIIDSMTGREQIRLFVDYTVYLEEKWSFEKGNLAIEGKWIRLDIVQHFGNMEDPNGPEMPEADKNNQSEFPYDKILSSMYITSEDWDKLKPEWIFEKKWTARKGRELPALIKERNFPAVVSSIFLEGDSIASFINYRKGNLWRDSLFNEIAYNEFYKEKKATTIQPEIEILENFKIEIRTDTVGIDYKLSDAETYLLKKNKAFLSSKTYKEILDLSLSNKIRKYSTGYGQIDSSTNYPSQKNLNSSFFLMGDLLRKDGKVSFNPKKLIVVSRDKKKNYFHGTDAFYLNIEDLKPFGLTYNGQSLYNYLSSLDYFFYPVSINKSQIHSYKTAFEIKKSFLSGKWEEIDQLNKGYFGCDWSSGIDPNLYIFP